MSFLFLTEKYSTKKSKPQLFGKFQIWNFEKVQNNFNPKIYFQKHIFLLYSSLGQDQKNKITFAF
jgi:hypothetical protein